ncbi:FAD-dependent oxidoreductase [Ferrimonas marina]|uniref:2-octaprenylphenol hydroxylase n=1 Tax=Ferrimonas marina TaxID=299255 RepID=A0A1M5ZFC9_9GAMM|nr:FAD-dependent oxidoreductase [Ferrimonas marina]SHI22872.1 2-octaprenylphenol hydroxylase [Ferrimonas marina]
MMKSLSVDVAIVGGGMVGMATALGLAQAGYQVAVVERSEPQPVQGEPRLRVSAINRASQQWLTQLGAWSLLPSDRLAPYRAMQVWDKDSLGAIGFAAEDLEQPDLGHIIENDAIAYALWQRADSEPNLHRVIGAPERWAQGEREDWLSLASGEMITARLLLAADGANSWLRQQAQVPLVFRDYGHHALVATIRSQHPHDGVARQVFLPEGPLALLPLADPHLCSIVWSQPPALAEQRQALSPEEFGQALTVATEARLGCLSLASDRAVFPLTMRYARDFVRPRLALLGDAAHTIHPLAGQGVNLGFGDGKALVELLASARGSDWDIGDLRLLNRYGRARKAAAQEMLAAMDGFRWLFAGSHPLKKSIRDLGLSLVDKAGPVKNRLLARALGLEA